MRQIDFFISDLFIEKNTFDDFVVHDDVNVMFRDVRLFVRQIQHVNIERQFKLHLNSSDLINYFLKDEIKQ